MARSCAEIAAEIAAALMKRPRTMRQLREMVGISERHNPALTRYIEQFRAAGCVYVSGWTLYYAPIFAWQAYPFALPDVPRPVSPHALAAQARAVGMRLGC